MPIEPEPYDIAAEDAVDLVGRSYSFSHHKGIVEWLKNSWDAYQRKGQKTDFGLIVVLEFQGNGKSFRTVRVADFCGMTGNDIDRAFKRWFDVRAATQGAKFDAARILGGHGNGGKFYMRQMFNESNIITWTDGILNQFGFDSDHAYGYERGRRSLRCTLEDALKIAHLPFEKIPAKVIQELGSGRTGFTVVEGVRARGSGSQVLVTNVIESLKQNPQMMRLLPHMEVSLWHGEKLLIEKLLPELPDVHPDVASHFIQLPGKIQLNGDSFGFGSGTPSEGLEVKIADRALSGRLKVFNRLDVIGRFGVVANYPMSELPLSSIGGPEFLFATLRFPGVEALGEELVDNARERLIQSPKTTALLEWASTQIDLVAQEVNQFNAQQKRHVEAAATARLTNMLNQYSQRFLKDFFIKVTGGPGTGEGFGGSGGGGGPIHTGGTGSGRGTSTGGGSGGERGGGAGTQTARVRRYPQVLVAGVDRDPLSDSGESLELVERHPTLYQRAPYDVDARIYWINTQAIYPREILDKYGPGDPLWKMYLLMRHRDVVVKEALRYMADNEALDLTSENINNRMDELTDDFLNSLDQAIADDILGS